MTAHKELKRTFSSLKMVPSMKESGLRAKTCEMAVAFRYGLTDLAMRDTGRATKPTVEED